MTTQHTTGPWKRRTLQSQPIVSTGWHIEGEDGASLAIVLGDKSAELQANARLIAAAPDLLEALEAAVGTIEYALQALEAPDKCHARDVLEEARAAINKAK